MKEDLLHFIWKLQLFSSPKLKTVGGEELTILSAGKHNLHSGADFFNAQLRIGNQLWAGNVEIHLKSSDWYAHHHEEDRRYDAVILHIVWEYDVPVFNKNNQPIPTLQLKDWISSKMLEKYHTLFLQPQKWIYCEKDITAVDSFKMNHWLERLYIQRLEQKMTVIKPILEENKYDWEATLFVLLAKNFGLKVNGEVFLQIAKSLDFSVIRKESHQLEVLEALLFGQSALLNEDKEFLYYRQLQKEYQYLQKKYSLQPIAENQLQFFRLRPPNFPTIRISQLAMLYHQKRNLFADLMKIDNTKDFYKILKVGTSDFWKTHYTFDKTSKSITKNTSTNFIDLLIINTIVPLRFAYEQFLGKDDFEPILELIKAIKPEKNTIISHFKEVGITAKNAFETQALLQLKNEMCQHQKCLECLVGKELLKG
ncbi:MAG: DUF2851 family protein [Flavobacteriaceae bacterium]|nr:DUF2851 family protein [Flavobacteriaceae bacterium]